MQELTRLIYEDMKPALGVTEPGAIAFAMAKAREHLPQKPERATLRLNSGMYKNAFTCGIPGISQVGNEYAAALGLAAADADKELECLDGISPKEKEEARALAESGNIQVEMTEISSRIFIEAICYGGQHSASVLIRDAHTNIVRISEDGKTVFEKEDLTSHPQAKEKAGEAARIHSYSLKELLDYVQKVPAKELSFIEQAFEMNRALMEEGLSSEKTTFAPYLLAKNGGLRISDDAQKTASLYCNAAIEARVIGLSRPAMSITGSGAHGIIATMPLLAAKEVLGYSQEALLRATALSYLVCMYIKEYSGKLSAFCGCAIAAGTGMALGLAYLRGGELPQMEQIINNMASSITGMICDGGNQGCTMKGIVAVDAAFAAVDLSMSGVSVLKVHGINGKTPEDTMKYMGMIASPGMVGTEKTIVEIMQKKAGKGAEDEIFSGK